MKRIKKEEIAEMEAMLNHLYFATNNTASVEISLREFLRDYKVKNKHNISAYLNDSNVLLKTGKGKGTTWRWRTAEKPSKMMARRVIEGVRSKIADSSRKSEKTKPQHRYISSTDRLDRKEFENRLRMVNSETGEFKDEVSVMDKLKDNQDIKTPEDLKFYTEKINKEAEDMKRDFLNKYSTEENSKVEFSILWGLFSYSNK